MKRYFSIFVVLISFVSLSMCYSLDVFAFFESKQDRIVSEPGMMWGAGFELKWNDFSFYSEVLETNFKIGDISPKWPIWGKLFENTYYPFGQSILAYESPQFRISTGMQNLNEGLGQEYPLFISSNNTPYPSVEFEVSPFEWLSFQQDLILVRTAVDNPLTAQSSQTSKSVYYRKTTVKPFEFLKIGFQESVLFMGRDFDIYYLLSPLNYIMSQDIRATINAPWKEPVNDNCMVGGFIEFTQPQYRIFSEVLVDDWSWKQGVGVIKMAWNTGLDFNFDRNYFQFEFAGASKYTFHRTGKYPYQYVRYESIPELPIEYNMIGYKYGENNAAFSARYTYKENDYDFGLSYEHLVFGSRDPFSPLPPDWKDHSNFRWLDDPVLQRENYIALNGRWNITPKIELNGEIGASFVENEGLVQNKSNVYPRFDFSIKYTFPINEEVMGKISSGKIFDLNFF